VVEDEPSVRKLLVKVFETVFHYRVTAFPSADLALAHILELKPRLVLSDTEMPGKLNGIALLIKVKEVLPATVFINMSGRPEFMQAAEINGSDGFIVKPFELPDLVKIVKELIGS